MNILEGRRWANLELQRRWSAEAATRHAKLRPVTLSSGEVFDVVEYPQRTALLWDKPIASSRLSAEMVWHVAFDAIALRLKLRNRIAAYIRPLRFIEIKNGMNIQVLDSLASDFRETREQAIIAIERGEAQSYCIRRNDQLLAHLGHLPPLTSIALREVTRAEMDLLGVLRGHDISADELRDMLHERLLRRSGYYDRK